MAARAKAPNGTQRRGARDTAEIKSWPLDADGVPMTQISLAASELIPTGNYANVVVGPVMVTTFVGPDGKLPIGGKELASALNELAEIIEADCIAEQREIVLKGMQADVEAQNSK